MPSVISLRPGPVARRAALTLVAAMVLLVAVPYGTPQAHAVVDCFATPLPVEDADEPVEPPNPPALEDPQFDRDAYMIGQFVRGRAAARTVLRIAERYERVCLNDLEGETQGEREDVANLVIRELNEGNFPPGLLDRIYVGGYGQPAAELGTLTGVDVFAVAPDPGFVSGTLAGTLGILVGPGTYAYVATEFAAEFTEAIATQVSLSSRQVAVSTPPVVFSTPRAGNNVPLRSANWGASSDVYVYEIQRALYDFAFVVDTTGSMDYGLETLQTQGGGIIDALVAQYPDAHFGVGDYRDHPVSPWGSAGDYPWALRSDLSAEPQDAYNALTDLELGDGGTVPESGYDAVKGAAEEFSWRPGSRRVIFLVTDAAAHDRDQTPSYPGAGFTEAVNALVDVETGVIGIQQDSAPGATAFLDTLTSALGVRAPGSGPAILPLDDYFNGAPYDEEIQAIYDIIETSWNPIVPD